MRILHVVGPLGGRGGAEEHFRGVVERLGAAGHEVQVAAGEMAGTHPPCRATRVPGLEAGHARAIDLEPRVRAFRPDVIHLHNIMNPAALEWAVGRPALVTVQDHRFFCPGQGKWTASDHRCAEPMAESLCAGCFEDPAYFREIHRLTTSRLMALRRLQVVVLSRYMASELVAAGLSRSAVRVIAPFVHGLDRSARADGPPCVAFVGRLARAKGVDDAVEAWRRSGVDLPLIFAGTGPERGRLERSGFEVLGWLRRDALARFYRRAAAMLMPPRWQEPFGLVGIEALSLGTPVVAWNSGGIPEWYSGDSLVPWGDTAGLAQALGRAVARGRLPPDDRFGAEEPMRRLVDLYDSMRARGVARAALG